MTSKEFRGGVIRGNTWTVAYNTESYYSDKFYGFQIPDEVFDALIDAGVETIVFVDPGRGRYTSLIDDWLELGVDWNDSMHLRQSWMIHG